MNTKDVKHNLKIATKLREQTETLLRQVRKAQALGMKNLEIDAATFEEKVAEPINTMAGFLVMNLESELDAE